MSFLRILCYHFGLKGFGNCKYFFFGKQSIEEEYFYYTNSLWHTKDDSKLLEIVYKSKKFKTDAGIVLAKAAVKRIGSKNYLKKIVSNYSVDDEVREYAFSLLKKEDPFCYQNVTDTLFNNSDEKTNPISLPKEYSEYK